MSQNQKLLVRKKSEGGGGAEARKDRTYITFSFFFFFFLLSFLCSSSSSLFNAHQPERVRHPCDYMQTACFDPMLEILNWPILQSRPNNSRPITFYNLLLTFFSPVTLPQRCIRCFTIKTLVANQRRKAIHSQFYSELHHCINQLRYSKLHPNISWKKNVER